MRHMGSVQAHEGMRHANELAAAADAHSRQTAQQQASHATELSQCQEQRGEAMLRAEQLAAEANRLREMVNQLKKHDDELYASQTGSTAELRQLRASLASAEERIATSRMALEEESTRRLEAERRLAVAQTERVELVARSEKKAELEATLAALQATSTASLAQYKEDNAVLVSEVKRLQSEVELGQRQVAALEDSGASTADQLEAQQRSAATEAKAALFKASDEAASAQREAEKFRLKLGESQAALRALQAELREAANGVDTAAGEEAAGGDEAAVQAEEAGSGGEAALALARKAGGGGGGGGAKAVSAVGEGGAAAVKLLVAERARLRSGLKSAAEQVQLAQRKLSRATARNNQLTSQLAEAGAAAEASAAAARSADSARLRDEALLRSEQQVSERLRDQLAQQSQLAASAQAQAAHARSLLPRLPANAAGGTAEAGHHAAQPVEPVGGEPAAVLQSAIDRADVSEVADSWGGSGGGAGVAESVVAEAVADATRELATALAEALTDGALESCRLDVVLLELASTEEELHRAMRNDPRGWAIKPMWMRREPRVHVRRRTGNCRK